MKADFSAFLTPPREQYVIAEGSKLEEKDQLEPPGEQPVVFSCRLKGVGAVGCVFPNGLAMVVPNRCSGECGPWLYSNFGFVERDKNVTDICFVWQVVEVTC